MMTVLLYGPLGKQFGRVHKYDVQSAAEAIRALCATIQGFRPALAKTACRVLVGGHTDLGREQLRDPLSQRETLRIVPVIAGAGHGLGQILMGAALIALSFTIPESIPFIDASLTTGISVTTFASYASTIGLTLLIGGVSQMLFQQKAPSSPEKPDNQPSYAFNGAVNTAAQGGCVPVMLGGPMIVGSQIVYAGLTVENMIPA